MAEIEALYRTEGPALLQYLRRSFSWCAAAEDLLQETFVQAIGVSEWQTADSPRAFLFGIARHVGLTAARHAAVRKVEPIRDMPGETESAELVEMRAAIERLPEQLRQTLDLRLHGRLSYEEIAEALDIPIGTVRSRLHTAMRLLREEMEKP
jgi:RNA polymerase sigma-70 factor (ECF subfamily)